MRLWPAIRSVLTLMFLGASALVAFALWQAYRTRPQELLTAKDPLYFTRHSLPGKEASAPIEYILLLSSAYTCGDIWRLLLQEYWPKQRGAKRYEFIIPDLLGTGRSPWPPPNTGAYTMDSHCAAIKRMLKDVVPPAAPLHIVGICMGGLIGLHLAAELRPASLSLISMPYFKTGEEAWSTGEKYAVWYRKPWLLEIYARTMVRQRWLFGRWLWAKVEQRYPRLGGISRSYCNGSPKALQESLLHISCLYRPHRDALLLRDSTVRTLYCYGLSDALCINEANDFRNDSGASMVLFNNMTFTHNMLLRHPQTVIGSIVNFIAYDDAKCPNI